MNAKNPLVSIIIPTYCRWDLTGQCLRTLKNIHSKIPCEVIISDNASTDETVSKVRQEWPEVRLLTSEKNEDFSGACNKGASAARGELIVFLNSDTIPFEGWLEPLVDEITNGASIVGSKLVYPDGTVQHAGVCFMRENRFPYHPFRGFSAEAPEVNIRRELQCVTGACMAMKKQTFLDLGQFDTGFRNGGEDVDLCIKAHRSGRKVVYAPKSALIHLESQSPGRMNYNEQNINYFYQLWPDAPIADEDWYYFGYGYHRVGDRDNVAVTPLAKFVDEADFQKWKLIADLQEAFCTGHIDLARERLSAFYNEPLKTLPRDSLLLEWLAFLARRCDISHAALELFAAACEIRQREKLNDAIKNLSQCRLHPALNKFFACSSIG